MKLLIFTILFSTKIFAGEMSIETIQNIRCYHYDDPNQYPILLAYFSGSNEEEIQLTLNQAANNYEDDVAITTLFQDKIKLIEAGNKLIASGKDLYLEMITPISNWGHGDARDSKLELSSHGIKVQLVCELQ